MRQRLTAGQFADVEEMLLQALRGDCAPSVNIRAEEQKKAALEAADRISRTPEGFYA